MRRMNKKGILFTFVAILLTSIVVFSFITKNTYNEKESMNSIESRVFTMNEYLKDLDKDLQRALWISSYRGLLSIENEIISTGNYLNNTQDIFSELIEYGTINNIEYELMEESSLLDWSIRMKSIANTIGLRPNFIIEEIKITQKDPWTIEPKMTVNINLNDIQNTAVFNITKIITTQISIINFEDPLYIIESQGRTTNQIIKTPFQSFVINNDTTNLKVHLNNSYYISNTDAPSFLMRLEGNLNPSEFGIESLVNLDDLRTKDISIKSKTVVDYLYFSEIVTQDSNIKLMPDWFILDSQHLEFYEVEGLVEG